MDNYYDRFGTPKQKLEDTKKNEVEERYFVVILVLLIALFAALGTLSGCSSTAHTCAAYDTPVHYTKR